MNVCAMRTHPAITDPKTITTRGKRRATTNPRIAETETGFPPRSWAESSSTSVRVARSRLGSRSFISLRTASKPRAQGNRLPQLGQLFAESSTNASLQYGHFAAVACSVIQKLEQGSVGVSSSKWRRSHAAVTRGEAPRLTLRWTQSSTNYCTNVHVACSDSWTMTARSSSSASAIPRGYALRWPKPSPGPGAAWIPIPGAWMRLTGTDGHDYTPGAVLMLIRRGQSRDPGRQGFRTCRPSRRRRTSASNVGLQQQPAAGLGGRHSDLMLAWTGSQAWRRPRPSWHGRREAGEQGLHLVRADLKMAQRDQLQRRSRIQRFPSDSLGHVCRDFDGWLPLPACAGSSAAALAFDTCHLNPFEIGRVLRVRGRAVSRGQTF